MSTRSVIGYETEEGGFVGCYMHFDGYPDNIKPQLESIPHFVVKTEIERALTQSGLRCLDKCSFTTYGDFRNETSNREDEVYSEWPCRDQEYNYIKRLNGSVECVKHDGERF